MKLDLNSILLEPSPPKISSTIITPCIPHEFGTYLAQLLQLDMKKGPWLAGGVLQKLYQEQEVGLSDWDIWFNSQEQFDTAYAILTKNKYTKSSSYSTKNAVTLGVEFQNKMYTVQLIRKQFFNSPQEVINEFDFTICQLISDGYTLLTGPNTASDLKSKTIRLANPIIKPNSIAKRLIKYMAYGYQPTFDLIHQIQQTDPEKWSNNDTY